MKLFPEWPSNPSKKKFSVTAAIDKEIVNTGHRFDEKSKRTTSRQ